MTKIFILLFPVLLICACSDSGGKTKNVTKSPSSVSTNNNSTNTTTIAVNDVNSIPGDQNSNMAWRQRPSANRMNPPPRVDSDPEATPLPLHFKQAPENSEIAVTMNKDGSILQVRVFKSNPQILKVEATTVGADESTLKFYFRNGKVSEVKTKSIPNLQNESTAKLLELAGIKSSAPAADRPRISK